MSLRASSSQNGLAWGLTKCRCIAHLLICIFGLAPTGPLVKLPKDQFQEEQCGATGTYPKTTKLMIESGRFLIQ